MPSIKTIVMASAIALASSANAHMKMSTPIPFGDATLDNSPLDASGKDFPCKQRPGVYDASGAKNAPMAIGAPQTLSLVGGATHGGGSCQISLTSDKTPNKDSKWQVIHSIEGDCPSGVDGNQGSSASDTGATKFQYTIPEGIKPGDYVLAWTWFNRIGNREMYMNCAPVTVTGGSKKRSIQADVSEHVESFTDMFKANIDSACSSPGHSICSPDGKQIGKCNGTNHVFFPVAQGTVCKDGRMVLSGSPLEARRAASAIPMPEPARPAVVACSSPGHSVCSPDGKQIGNCDGTKHVIFFPVAQGTVCKEGRVVLSESSLAARRRHHNVTSGASRRASLPFFFA
ncbi:hypothetical protein MMC29_005126 [Sticta canariensis]|nr:hypothetical protein [Sticta canariensis]